MKKLIYRAGVLAGLISMTVALIIIGNQLKRMNDDVGPQLKRLNDHIEFIREQIPLSMLNQ